MILFFLCLYCATGHLDGWNSQSFRYDYSAKDSLGTTIDKNMVNEALRRSESFHTENPTDSAWGQIYQSFMDGHTLLRHTY